MAGKQGPSVSAGPSSASVGGGSPAAGSSNIDITVGPGPGSPLLALPSLDAPAPKTPWMDIDITVG